MISFSPDIRLLFSTRTVRLFAYGFISVDWLYILPQGLEETDGPAADLNLAGDTVLSLWMTRMPTGGGRRMLWPGRA
jgi:hypothetical protein